MQPAPGALPLTNPLHKSVRDRGQASSSSAKRPQSQVAKIIEAELSVVVPEDGAMPTQHYVVLKGSGERGGDEEGHIIDQGCVLRLPASAQ